MIADLVSQIQPSTATLFLIGLVTAAWVWKRQRQYRGDLDRLPGPPNMPVIGGSSEWLSLVIAGKDHEYLESFPKRYGPILKANVIFNIFDIIFLSDANEANRVLTDTKDFRKDDFLESKAAGILDFALFTLSTGDLHRRHRKLIQPAFAPSHLRQVSKATAAVMKELDEILQSRAVDGKVVIENTDKLMMDVTLDVLGIVAFGKRFGSISGVKDQKTQIWQNLDDFTAKPWAIRLGLPEFLWSVAGVASTSPGIQESQLKMKQFFKSLAIESKDKIKAYLPSLNKDQEEEIGGGRDKKYELNVLERLLLSNEQGQMNEKEVFGEMLGFFLAGHETSSHTLSFTLMELAQNQEIQSSLYEEVKNVDLHQDNLNDALLPLKKLENCVKEAQRLHAVVGGIPREVVNNTEMLGYKLPAGTKILIDTKAIHLSPEYYDDPYRYNPDRWNFPPKNAHAFMAFGMGNHACIGMKMATIEIKMVLLCLLQKYRVSVDPAVVKSLTYTSRITYKVDNLKLIFEAR